MADFDHYCYIIFLIIFFFPGVINSSLPLGTGLGLPIKAVTNKLLGSCCSIVATLLQRHFEECSVIKLVINSQRLGSAFDDLDPRLSLLCQVGDDVIRPCKICGGFQIRAPRSIHSINVSPIQSRLQSALGMRSFYVEHNELL